MRVLTIHEISLIHDSVVTSTGGSLGLREPGLLAAISEKPFASFGGEDLYPTLFDKAAAIYEALCNYHVFVDGNKRTGITCLELFLELNGYQLNTTAKEKEVYTISLADSRPDLADVAYWIESHSKSNLGI